MPSMCHCPPKYLIYLRCQRILYPIKAHKVSKGGGTRGSVPGRCPDMHQDSRRFGSVFLTHYFFHSGTLSNPQQPKAPPEPTRTAQARVSLPNGNHCMYKKQGGATGFLRLPKPPRETTYKIITEWHIIRWFIVLSYKPYHSEIFTMTHQDKVFLYGMCAIPALLFVALSVAFFIR